MALGLVASIILETPVGKKEPQTQGLPPAMWHIQVGRRQMGREAFRLSILWRFTVALILALCLVPTRSTPVSALSVADYFSFTFTVQFSKTELVGSEVSEATAEAEATCINELPVSVSKAEITGRIIAEHQSSGTRVTLNPEYTLHIDPFPGEKGESTRVQRIIPLQFPEGSESGTYTVLAELVEAKIKVLLVWLTVTDYLPSSQTIGSVTYASSRGGAPGGRSGGKAAEEPEQQEEVEVKEEEPEPPPAVTDLPAGVHDVSGVTSDDGTFTVSVVAQSLDGRCELTIPEGTKGFSQEGDPLTEIAMTEMAEQPPPPDNYDIIGVAYDLGPDGATFDPPVTLTISYDESLIPEGTAEENLVMAVWHEATDEWVVMAGSTVDPDGNTVTAPVSHFTAFTVLAYVSPATFVTSELSVTPAEVHIGEEVTIRSLITNAGDLAGSYTAILRIDNVVVAAKEVSVEGGATEEVTFTVAEDVAGTYAVAVGGQSGTFVVTGPAAFIAEELSITPAEVFAGEEVTISALVTNTSDVAGSHKVTLTVDGVVVATKEVSLEGGISEEVMFTVAKDVAGTYAVAVDGLSGTFAVTIPPEPTSRWPLAGIIAASIAVALVLLLTVLYRRRRA